jgi:hypothetical protein
MVIATQIEPPYIITHDEQDVRLFVLFTIRFCHVERFNDSQICLRLGLFLVAFVYSL